MANVATVVHRPAVAVAAADASALAPRIAFGTVVASVLIVVHEPAATVATANVFAATSTVVVPALASTGTAVHEPAVLHVFTPAPHSAAAAGAIIFEITLRTADRVGGTPPVLICPRRARMVLQ